MPQDYENRFTMQCTRHFWDAAADSPSRNGLKFMVLLPIVLLSGGRILALVAILVHLVLRRCQSLESLVCSRS